ncbi:MAG: MFS transporter [Patescibacteria group bacterium]
MKNTTRFYLIGFLRGLYFYLPLFTVFLTGHDVGMEIVVFSQFFYSFVQFIAEVPTGVLADKLGQRASMIVGYFIEALGLVTVVLFPTAIGACLCYAIGGLAAAFLSGSEEALLFESAKKEKADYGAAYGKFLSNATIGMIVATGLGGFAYAAWGAEIAPALLWATAIALMICAFLSFGFPELRSAADVQKQKGSGMWKSVTQGYEAIKKEDFLRNMTIVMLLIVPGEYFLYNIYQPLFEGVHVEPIWFGLSISLGLAFNAFVMRYMSWFERRFTLPTLIFAVSVIIGMGYFLVSLTSSPWVAVTSVIMMLGFVEVHRPIISDYLNERIASHQRTTVLSLLSFTNRVASAALRIVLALTVAGYSVAASGVVHGVYLMGGAIISYWLLAKCGCAHRIKHPPKIHTPSSVAVG